VSFYNFSEQYVYGQIEKSKPQTNYPFHYADPLNLKLTDIDGSQFGSKNRINKYNSKYSGLVIEDVPGAQSSSLKKGISTQRKTNPLNPQYFLPGQKEIIKPENNPYGKTSFDFKPRTTSFGQRKLPKLKSDEGEKPKILGSNNHRQDDGENLINNGQGGDTGLDNNPQYNNNGNSEKVYSHTEGNAER
jgi:hypothetical protein